MNTGDRLARVLATPLRLLEQRVTRAQQELRSGQNAATSRPLTSSQLTTVNTMLGHAEADLELRRTASQDSHGSTSPPPATVAGTGNSTTPQKLEKSKTMKLQDAFPSKFLRAGDLDGATQDVVAKVTQELVGDDTKLVVAFRNNKPLALNKTNARALAELARSEETDDWAGLEVELYPTETSFKGDVVACVRIRRPLPREHGADAPIDDRIPF